MRGRGGAQTRAAAAPSLVSESESWTVWPVLTGEAEAARTGARLEESIMMGDSLEVDILGALNAGMDQVHVNHLRREREALNGVFPTYTIFSLQELELIF